MTKIANNTRYKTGKRRPSSENGYSQHVKDDSVEKENTSIDDALSPL